MITSLGEVVGEVDWLGIEVVARGDNPGSKETSAIAFGLG